MRKITVFGLTGLALLATVASNAFAQAPAPTFKITGFIQVLSSYASNSSFLDTDLHRAETQWFGRSRGRFDIIGEYGKAKAVLGLELDMTYGQTGSNDSTIVNAGAAATTAVTAPAGTSGSFDLNTDSRGIPEIKWLYVETDLPFMPVPTIARIGAQPFGAAATYKLAAYATGDYPGVNVVSTITPNFKLNATYVAVEERLEGGGAVPGSPGVPLTQLRGDDWAFIISPEFTPFKGLDIKPMYSYFTASGTTSTSTRMGRGGINTSTNFTNADGTWRKGINEDRHTVGIDARFRSGPFFFDPTVLYQFGSRHVVGRAAAGSAFVSAGVKDGHVYYAPIDAWLLDLRAGYQLGPLLLEAMYMYTTGNTARNTTLGHVRYFQALDTDSSYLGDWGQQITRSGTDFSVGLFGGGSSTSIFFPGRAIGFDKYGFQQISARATYAWTPTLSMFAGAAGMFTAEAVDSDGVTSAAGITPVFAGRGAGGDDKYFGTELFGGITWQFAPGITWLNTAGYLFSGGALNALTNPAHVRDAKDVYVLSSRITFSF